METIPQGYLGDGVVLIQRIPYACRSPRSSSLLVGIQDVIRLTFITSITFRLGALNRRRPSDVGGDGHSVTDTGILIVDVQAYLGTFPYLASRHPPAILLTVLVVFGHQHRQTCPYLGQEAPKSLVRPE